MWPTRAPSASRCSRLAGHYDPCQVPSEAGKQIGSTREGRRSTCGERQAPTANGSKADVTVPEFRSLDGLEASTGRPSQGSEGRILSVRGHR